MTLIADNQALTVFCERLAGEDFITVDTEFIRDKTYWPRLCLIQMAGADVSAAIDTLAPGLDLAPVYALLSEPRILKVFHAARQDIEIFFHQARIIPAPLFDSQVAAMVCGFGDAASYETLVAKLAKARVDKSSRFTDWAARPLTDKQLTYALSDVTYLRTIYQKLSARLERDGRSSWLEDEMAALTAPEIYQLDPDKAWRRIKLRNPKPRYLAVLREIAAWREREARSRDVPRNRIVRDEALTEKLKEEWPGILQWMIEGCLMWQGEGLRAPEAVRRATEEYLDEEDAFTLWREECCQRSPMAHETTASLFASWKAWADRTGEAAGTQKRFSQTMQIRDFEPKREGGTGRKGFNGIRLNRANYTDDPRHV